MKIIENKVITFYENLCYYLKHTAAIKAKSRNK
jgi:hypothetical protein